MKNITIIFGVIRRKKVLFRSDQEQDPDQNESDPQHCPKIIGLYMSYRAYY